MDGGIIPPHAENPVKYDHNTFDTIGNLFKAVFKVSHIIVFENALVNTRDIADPHGPDNAVMVELVPNPMGFIIGNGEGKPAV